MTSATIFKGSANLGGAGPGTPNSARDIDEAVERLKDGAKRFAALSLGDRIALARSMQRGYAEVAAASVKTTCEAKGVPTESAGAEWALGPWIAIRGFRLIIKSLEALILRERERIKRQTIQRRRLRHHVQAA